MPTPSNTLILQRQLTLDRLKKRREQAKRQLQLISGDALEKETIRGKLDGLNTTTQFYNFTRCGEELIYRTCRCCGVVEKFTYRCNLKWCPLCSWRLVKKRQQLLQLWANKIKQPKHLVLTQKNLPILTRKSLKLHTRNLAKLRKSKCFEKVRGGSVSVEITNEGRGWHTHSHWLIDVDWLDMPAVSQTWARLVGQDFAICKVMDVREKSYVMEVTKYVVEGSELARWPAEHINEFVHAIRGRRFFFTFGHLRNFAAAVREELEFLKPEAKPCECGEVDFTFETEAQTVINEVRRIERRQKRR